MKVITKRTGIKKMQSKSSDLMQNGAAKYLSREKSESIALY